MNWDFSNYFQNFFKFFRGSAVLGIDIGSSAIKIVELTRKGTEFSLTNYAKLETKDYLDHPNRALQTSSLKIVEKEAVYLLKAILREMKPRAKKAMIAIPAFATFTASLEMPVLSREETTKSVKFQAKQLMPVAVSELSIDWLKMAESQNADTAASAEKVSATKKSVTQKIMLIGIPKEIINKYKNIFRRLPVSLVEMEYESFAATRALITSDDPTTMVIDIGAESTNVVFADSGQWEYNAQVDYGGVYLTQALNRGLGVSVSRAEILKKRKGLLGTGGEAELSTLLVPFLDVIIQEVKRTRVAYEAKFGKRVQQAILIGGGANLLGIEKYFSQNIDLPLLSPKPFNHISYPKELDFAIKNVSKDFAVAVGLAEKYFL